MDLVTSFDLLKKGAEASLYAGDWQNRRVVVKARFPKAYRPEKLDLRIRTYRTLHEPQLMHEAKRAGVATPKIFQVDTKNSMIVMELIEGKQVKECLSGLNKNEREKLCQRIGQVIGRLHKNDLVHGDLTTSNMLLDGNGRIVMVDFGLGEKTVELEAKGVDLHLMKRALQSTHYKHADECFASIMRGYSIVLGTEKAKSVLTKVSELERRGRYVAERKQKLAS